MNEQEQLNAAIFAFEFAAYKRGLRQGIAVAEKITGWLTRQPDHKWQQEVRAWSEEAIRRANESIDTPPQ